MKESNNPIVKAYYDKLSTEYSARLDELEKQIADKQKAQDLLRTRWEKTGKVSQEEVEKWDTLTKEIEDLMNSEEYKNLSFIKQMIENPVENVKLSRLVTKLKQLQTKQKVFGKLDATDEKELNKMFKTLVDEVIKGNELVENFFSEFRFDKAGSGRIGKTLKDFIAEHMDADITKQFKDFYDTKYEEFDKFARENVEAYKKSWTDQMVKRLQKAGVDLGDVFKDISKKDIEARYRAIKSFLDTYENVDEVNLKLDKRSNAYKIQQELQKKISEMNIFKNKFEQFVSTQDLIYDEAYRVSGYTSQAAMRKRSALIKEGIKTMLSMDTSKAARQEIVVNLEELMGIIDKETFSDLESLNIFVNDIHTYLFLKARLPK
jgi:hypothetical protein